MMLTDEEIYALKWAQKSEKYTSRRYVEETDTNEGYYEDVEVCADSTVAFARAVIEANNAKVLADLKPRVLVAELGYSADTVSALIQNTEH